MKLDKPKKITLGVLSFLILWALILTIPSITSTIKQLKQKPINTAISYEFEKEELQAIRKYDLFPEFFKSKEPIFIYGYKPNAVNGTFGQSFHDELTKLFEKEQVKHKVIPYKNWDTEIEKYEKRYLQSGDENTCSGMTAEQETIEDVLMTIDRCLQYSCIIDMKNNRRIRVTRDPKYIIEVLKGNVEISD